MPAPYRVTYGYYGDRGGQFATLDAAIVHALTAVHRRWCEDNPPTITGDGVDADCDQDGYYMCSDGLGDDERERIEDAGL